MLVRDRIIVLDDLERRDAALSLETLFGYVDALKGKGCTVLLIYNEEELSANQGKEWRAVRKMPGRGDQSSAHADRCLRTRPGSRLRGPCGDPGHSPPAGPDEHTDHQAPGAADRHIQAAHVRTGSPLAPPDFVVNSLVF